MTIRPARESDLPELLAIYNYEVEHGVATLDLNPRTPDEWKEWFSAHQTDSHFILAGEENGAAIGYASLSAVGDTVKMVTVGGVECSEETVKDGSYEVQRPFVFVTNKSVTLSEQAQAFFDFATSTDAADLIRTAGAVPVNE